LVEKAARGMRHVKRAVRGDLARFKAFIEVQESESGAWRGVIHDGKVVKERDSKSGKAKAKASKAKAGKAKAGKAKARSRQRSSHPRKKSSSSSSKSKRSRR
jgi:hypothetical protein